MQNFKFGEALKADKVIMVSVVICADDDIGYKVFKGKAPTLTQLCNVAKACLKESFHGRGKLPSYIEVALMAASKHRPGVDQYAVLVRGEPQTYYLQVTLEDADMML